VTVPKWLIPVIAVIAAIAVGIAAVMVGGLFVTPQRVESNVETGTTTTPLYGPSGFGDEDDLIELPEGAFGASPEVGTIEVSTGLPDDPGVTPLEEATERIADGGAAGDDIPTVPVDESTGAPAGDEPSTPAVDPCLADDGDCPEGSVESRIFALISPPEYLVRVRAFAPTEICPAAPTGGVSLLVFMSRPSDVRMTVHEAEGGGIVHEFEGSTPAEIATRWHTALAEAEEGDPLPPLWLCFAVPAVEPGVLYLAAVDGDSHDGSSASDSTEFNGAGPTHHPQLTVEPVGEGAAVAYTEHTADEQVAIRAWVMPDGATGTPDCYSTDEYTEIPWRYRAHGELTRAETGNLLIPPDADQRTAISFQVPEGSTILFCATWHPGSEAPSWERVQSLYADGAILRTTDYVLPEVTLVRVDIVSGLDVEEVGVFGRTQEGMQCGGVRFDLADEAMTLPRVVCDLEGASVDFDVREWAFQDVGFTGNIVIPSTITVGGTEYRTDGTLNIGDLMCIGGCPTNPTTRYTIPLPEVAGRSAGQITLQVAWIQGNSNHQVRPVVSDVPQREGLISAGGGALAWANPMMDTDERMSYSRVDSSSLSGVATLHLVTDRPVDYTVSLQGIGGSECAVGDATLSTSGHSDGEADVEVSGLCFGTFYWATVRLTDDYGASSTFSASRGGVMRWLASLVRVPSVEVRVQYAAVTTTAADSAVAPGSYITIDGAVLPLGARTCADGTLSSSGIVVLPITSHPVIDVHISTVPALTNDSDLYCSGMVTPDSEVVVADGTQTLDLEAMREAVGETTITIGGLTLILTVLA
jgi:hypothetical protein